MIFSKLHNVIVYDHDDPAKIVASIAGARAINGSKVAVPVTLFNMQLARVLGLPVPPVLDLMDYDYPMQLGRLPYEHQRHMASFAATHPRSFNLSEMGCVDAETEYLSPTGWRRMDQYDGGQVAQWHHNGRTEFVQPTEYVKSPCTEMYRFKTTKGIDQKLSAEHRVLWVDADGSQRVSSAARVAAMQERYARGWPGRFITTFTGQGGAGIGLTDAELRVQIAVIADGHFGNDNTTHCVLRIKKERKKHRLRKLLNDAGILFREGVPEYESALGFSVFKFYAPRHDKVFDAYYWNCSHEQMKIVADEAVNWDGSRRKDQADGFYSCEKQSADFVQYCYAATGRTASMVVDAREGERPLYCVHARKKAALLYLMGWTDAQTKTTPITVEPTIDGFKYCFMVPTSFLVFRRNGCIFISGNTGKTLALLWAADFLMRQGIIHKALILSPLSTLKRVWDDEIFRAFCDRRKATILHGSRNDRVERLHRNVDFYILNHDGLGIGSDRVGHKLQLGPIAESIRSRDDIDLIIIDEASAYKDGATLRSRILRQVISNKPYIWLASGTPTPNAPTDAWSLARLVGNCGAESFQNFRMRTMLQISNFKWIPKQNSAAIVRQVLSPAVRFSREECIDLPECVVETRDVEMSPTQEKAYKELKKDLKVTLAGGQTITAFNEAGLRMKLIQISCGACYGPNHEVIRTDCGPRIQVLKEVIDEAGAKVLVLAPLTSVVNLLFSELKEAYGENAVARVYGATSANTRNEVFGAFENEENPKIIVADPGVLSHGLTLVAANTIVWFGPTDKPEQFEQTNARINRPGQTKKTLIVQLTSTPIEREIYKRLAEKRSLQGTMLLLVEADR